MSAFADYPFVLNAWCTGIIVGVLVRIFSSALGRG
jgi:hypothetical protein